MCIFSPPLNEARKPSNCETSVVNVVGWVAVNTHDMVEGARYVDENGWVFACTESWGGWRNLLKLKKNERGARTIPRMCAWIFNGGIPNNSPALTCCCMFSLWINEHASYLLDHCVSDVWIRIIHGLWRFFGSLLLHKYHPCAPTALLSAPLACSGTLGSLHWFPEVLHAACLWLTGVTFLHPRSSLVSPRVHCTFYFDPWFCFYSVISLLPFFLSKIVFFQLIWCFFFIFCKNLFLQFCELICHKFCLIYQTFTSNEKVNFWWVIQIIEAFYLTIRLAKRPGRYNSRTPIGARGNIRRTWQPRG